MKRVNSERLDEILENVSLDDEYAYIFIEYDQRVISLHCLTEKIEIAGAKILEIITLKEEPEGNKSILFRLDIQETREVILNLLNHGFIKIKGYNPKVRTKLTK